MGFSKQEYWSGLPCPPPVDLPNPGIEPASLTTPALGGGFFNTSTTWASLVAQMVKNPPPNAGDNPWVRKIPQRKEWQPTPVFVPGKSRGQRCLVCYKSRGLQRVGHDWATFTLLFLKSRNTMSVQGPNLPGGALHLAEVVSEKRRNRVVSDDIFWTTKHLPVIALPFLSIQR